ncbi:MAG: radical SAM protein [Candidatus Helarchaeota archaeon]|nr:radical SAM protein [Candidatus Helarchaeota archaeon]
MKVVLIYPGVILKTPTIEKEYKDVPNFNLPLGILYLGQVLKDNGHDVTLYDHYVTGEPVESVVDWLKTINPDIVGFSVLTANLNTANAIAKNAKEWNPNLITVYGSYLPTFCAREILTDCKYVDICARGEGEHTIVELADALEKNKPLKNVLGISYRHNEKIVENPDRPLIQDLDSISFPKRDLIRQSYQFYGKIATIITSRGCPYSCHFCCCWKFCKRQWRLRSIENIIEELAYLRANGYRELLFTDDCFNAKPKRIMKLCYLMKKEKLDFAWHTLGRVTQSEPQFLKLMVNAGCKTLTYGIESANQRILDYYRKKATPIMAEQAVKNAKKARVENIGAGFIIGAPTETREEILNTVRFGFKLQKYGLNNLQFQMLYVTPGTTLYDEFVEQGLINPEKDWNKAIPAVDRYPNSISSKYLEHLSRIAFRDFVSSKSLIISEYFKSLKSMYRMKAISRILQAGGRNF